MLVAAIMVRLADTMLRFQQFQKVWRKTNLVIRLETRKSSGIVGWVSDGVSADEVHQV